MNAVRYSAVVHHVPLSVLLDGILLSLGLCALLLCLQLMNIIKSGPTDPVIVGQALTFIIRATFDARGPFTSAKIVDDLPVGLLPASTKATWVASNNALGRLTGSECNSPTTR